MAQVLAKREASITFKPFLLDPTIPPEGTDLRAHLAKKFGAVPDSMFKRVEEVARDAGIPLDFSKVTRYPSTLAALAIVRHAKPETHPALTSAIFDAYFLGSRDIGDPEVLADIASAHGFDRDEARCIARDASELDAAREEAQEMAAEGIRGVPFFIFNDRVAVSGAQPAAVFEQALEKSLSLG